MTYQEQLKHPKWQKKRLEILERDKFKCSICGDTDVTLHVHHKVSYDNNKKPWEYSDNDYETLCEHCHKSISDLNKQIQRLILSDYCHTSKLNEIHKILNELKSMDVFQLSAIYNVIYSIKITYLMYDGERTSIL
jgi:hypothetical protein